MADGVAEPVGLTVPEPDPAPAEPPAVVVGWTVLSDPGAEVPAAVPGAAVEPPPAPAVGPATDEVRHERSPLPCWIWPVSLCVRQWLTVIGADQMEAPLASTILRVM